MEIRSIKGVQNCIKNLLCQKNMSMRQLAKKSGVAQTTISAILQGRSKSPTIKTLCNLSIGFGIYYVDFFIKIEEEMLDY
ncbi:helix-turn-helix domain-containing protein [Alkalibacillus sp. S2W]|uniref:helix-turn-helix domain-containing protein n=1 Tax=Alkalibacillus sp. S2W TaxID=3386553 RepID=UPI00398CF5C3